MEVLIYPYPEMAYFVTSFAEDDLAFGESTVVLPACQVDRELVEQLLSLYRCLLYTSSLSASGETNAPTCNT